MLIRLFVGAVFVSEGIQKFAFPDRLGIPAMAKTGRARSGSHRKDGGNMRHHTVRTALAAFAAVPTLLLGTAGVAAGAPAHPGTATRATGQACSPAASAQRHDGDSSCFRRCDLACHKRTGGPSPYCRSTCKKQCGIG